MRRLPASSGAADVSRAAVVVAGTSLQPARAARSAVRSLSRNRGEQREPPRDRRRGGGHRAPLAQQVEPMRTKNVMHIPVIGSHLVNGIRTADATSVRSAREVRAVEAVQGRREVPNDANDECLDHGPQYSSRSAVACLAARLSVATPPLSSPQRRARRSSLRRIGSVSSLMASVTTGTTSSDNVAR